MLSSLSFERSSLRPAYLSGVVSPREMMAEVSRRIQAHSDPAVWIHLLTTEELEPYLARLDGIDPASLPLFGLPFAIKDNLDLAGVPTTAGCPAFAYVPTRSAAVVQRLIEAGAVPVGKTNLDQFATGLVGTRSPYGVPRNPFQAALIPGGSSSGSAVAVAAGLVSFALGTDTAGSGRVPASLQNLVGLKPTRGWFSNRGLVPACRTLDCVSIFSLTVDDASAVAGVCGRYDAEDPFSRVAPRIEPAMVGGSAFRFGIPADDRMEWFGDSAAAEVHVRVRDTLVALGGVPVTIDFEPFREAARLLYEGPWVAERWASLKAFHAHHADAIYPITRAIIEGGACPLAVEAFEATYRLAALKRRVDELWASIEFLVLPTVPTIYTRAEVEADPIRLNSRLGTYTNFANLLDLAALAVPAGMRRDGVPAGATLFGPAWSDGRLAGIGSRLQRRLNCTLGATGHPLPPEFSSPVASTGTTEPGSRAGADGVIEVAVVGAHLTGQPLNRQLLQLRATRLEVTSTAADYRLYALARTTPPKPGLVRVEEGAGAAIAVEVWAMDAGGFGAFVAAVPPPLAIGSLRLASGRWVKGFVCEPSGLNGAADITAYGGWLAYLADQPRATTRG